MDWNADAFWKTVNAFGRLGKFLVKCEPHESKYSKGLEYFGFGVFRLMKYQ